MDDLRFWAAVAVMLLTVGIAWGDLRRTVKGNREHADAQWIEHKYQEAERHAEHQATLAEIRDDVKRINGAVTRHDEILRIRRDTS